MPTVLVTNKEIAGAKIALANLSVELETLVWLNPDFIRKQDNLSGVVYLLSKNEKKIESMSGGDITIVCLDVDGKSSVNEESEADAKPKELAKVPRAKVRNKSK